MMRLISTVETILVAFGLTCAATVAKDDNDSQLNHAKLQIEWVKSRGGIVNDKLEFRPVDPKSSTLGVFAKSDIDKDEVLFSIPRECILAVPEDSEENEVCTLTQALLHEIQLGEDSSYAPYVQYLTSQPNFGMQIPSAWSDAGKALLLKVTGGTRERDDQILAPLGPVGWLDDEWIAECKGSDNPMDQKAFLTVIQRSWDDLLVPLLDMVNHRNGEWLNTRINQIDDASTPAQMMASRFIAAGEQVYSSYNKCEVCSTRATTYGTPELLRDYGFVESLPTQWIFTEPVDMGFVVDRRKSDDDDSNKMEFTWITPVPEEAHVEFLADQLERLMDVEELHLITHAGDDDPVPLHEWQVVKDFAKAYIVALDSATKSVWSTQGARCEKEQETCHVRHSRYDMLDALVPEEVFNIEGCDRRKSLDFSDYEKLETIRSPYQVIAYEKHPENHDVCFSLDTTLQICGSYRPHYHEMVVHYTARFLPQIKRVLWVGGGDSMLLHEILKYQHQSLELAVGLELDQAVTRAAFKYYGAQPHWDNEKVQWWYGDASKSLLMIPKEWYGTFDLVLVDLSETVMSMTVTEGLDILGALSLLLKPSGIFVKNEMYQKKMSELFRYSIQLDYYDVPVLCSQCLVLGSNHINFMEANLTDHDVDPMLNTLKEIDAGHYQIICDYANRPDSAVHCKNESANAAVPETQTSSPGIVLILEAEDVQVDLGLEALTKTIVSALEEVGLGVVSTIVEEGTKGAPAVVQLNEGYVMARPWSEHKYCAFDIHLWSNFQAMDRARHALLTAVGSSAYSSFRIVAGGLFGVSTWKSDEMSRGPKFTQECGDDDDDSDETAVLSDATAVVDKKDVAAIIEETLALASKKKEVAAVVFCGDKGELCNTLTTLTWHSAVAKVVPIYTCPNITEGIGFREGGSDLMVQCEKEITSTLKEMIDVKGGEKIRLLALDPGANFEMGQLLHKIVKKVRDDMFGIKVLALAPILDPRDIWRRVLLDKLLEIFFQVPSFRSEVLFNQTDGSSMEMGTFLTGDADFLEHLKDVNKAIEKRANLKSEVRNIHAGAPDFQENFVPSQFFLPGDYDHHDGYKQWRSQQPLGLQTVFQMILDPKSPYLTREQVGKMFKDALEPTGATPRKFSNLGGDGSLFFAMWSTGHAMVLFDGRGHVDLNIFTLEDSETFARGFAGRFSKNVLSLKVALRDTMPRGFGRVVNFKRDLKPPRTDQHWALGMIKTE